MPQTGLLIRDLPPRERPRERLLSQGGQALSDGELLAVLLRTGKPGTSVLGLATEVLAEKGGLAGLVDAQPRDLKRFGLGEAKACSVLAAVEIGRRLAAKPLQRGRRLPDPATVAAHVRLSYGRRDQEVLGALYLDSRLCLLAEGELYRGTVDRAPVEPRKILQEALLWKATKVLVFHTHPSGDPTPSVEDLEMTRHLAEACETVGLGLVDHLVVGHGGRWVSLKERGVC